MEHDFRSGDVLLGKYRLERMLGRGGMGSVYLARHVEMDELVAIKLLNRNLVENAESMARFIREAKAAVRIKSEHVVRVLDVARLESGEPCMVMEYLEGEDLEHRLARGVLTPTELADLLLQVCEALALAHAQDIVHRDLKPANLFVTHRSDRTPCVKVLDFGISKFAGTATTPSMTSTHGLLGSPLYMSPEQMSSAKNVDARTDLWALGVIMYQALTGTFPFNGESLPALVLDVMNKTPPPVTSLRPEVPLALELVVARCLEKDRAARYADVREFALALEPFASQLGRTHVPRILAALGGNANALGPTVAAAATLEAPNPRASTTREWASTAAAEPPRTQGRAVMFALAAVAFAGVGTSVWALSRPHEPPAASTPGSAASSAAAPTETPTPTPKVEPPAAPPSASASAAPPMAPKQAASAKAASTASAPSTGPSTAPLKPAAPAAPKPTSTETVIE